METTTTHRFNLLPAAVRERLVALTCEPANPYRLFGDATWRMAWVKYFFAVGSLVALAGCVQFIIQRTRMDHYTPWYDREVFFGAGVALFFFSISVLSIVYARVWPPPPYREGVYVTPAGIIRLRDGAVTLTDARELGRPTIVTHRTNGSYTHTSVELAPGVTFRFDKGPAAEAATTRYLTLRKNYLEGLARGDDAQLRSLDPFFECRAGGVWQQPPGELVTRSGPVDTPVPGRAQALRFVVSVGLAALLPGAAYLLMLMEARAR